MHESEPHRPLRAVILVGVAYFVVGIALAELANRSASNQMRFTWRFLAYVISAAVFAAHFGYEHFRLRSTPRSTAWRVTAAVAVGAFLLAAAANVHAFWSASGNHRLLAIALLAWPVLTAVPAFLVVLAAAGALSRSRRRQ